MSALEGKPTIIAVVCVGVAAAIALAAVGNAQEKKATAKDDIQQPPKSLPKDLEKAWTDAGASFESLSWDAFRAGDFGKKDEMPWFIWIETNWTPGTFAALPEPAQEFGIAMRFFEAPDFLKGIGRFKHLSGLELTEVNLTDAGLKEVSALGQLRWLVLAYTKTTDADLRHLSKLTKMELLNLYKNKNTDMGLKELTAMENLASLDLSYNPGIPGPGLAQLAKLKKLRILRMYGCEFKDEHIKDIAAIAALESLHFGGTNLTAGGIRQLAACKNLRLLDLGGFFTGEGLDQLGQLEELRIRDPLLTKEGLDSLGRLTRLKRLWLSQVRFGDPTFRAVSRLAGLEELAVSGNHLGEHALSGDAALSEMKSLKKLRRLLLSGEEIRITDAGLKHLVGLTELEMLRLSSIGVNDTGLKEIKRLKNLNELDLELTAVTDAGMEELKELKSLKELSLRNCVGITDASFKHIGQMKNLKLLRLGGTRVTPAAIAQLKKDLPQLSVK